MKNISTIIVALILSTSCLAADLSRYIGYKIVAKKTIAGWVEQTGTQRKSDTSFEGCNWGRRIVFDDNTYLTCQTYSYSYSYRPDAILLTNGTKWIMIVDNNSYDMSN